MTLRSSSSLVILFSLKNLTSLICRMTKLICSEVRDLRWSMYISSRSLKSARCFYCGDSDILLLNNYDLVSTKPQKIDKTICCAISSFFTLLFLNNEPEALKTRCRIPLLIFGAATLQLTFNKVLYF